MLSESISDAVEVNSTFDVVAYLNARGIQYWTEGENVSLGWVNIQCVFCSDPKNHLGIHLTRRKFNCWLCGESGDCITLVGKIDDVSFKRTLVIMQGFKVVATTSPDPSLGQKKGKGTAGNVLPGNLVAFNTEEDPLPGVLDSYLKRRRFSRSLLVEYDLRFCKYGDRDRSVNPLSLIVPIQLDGEVVSFQAADLTGKSATKYRDCPVDYAVIMNKHLVYGLESIGGQVIVVEGVTDRWRMGRDAKAFLGKNYTAEQFCLFRDRVPRSVPIKVLFDPDASEEAEVFARNLTLIYRDVRFIDLEGDRDPADLEDWEVEEILSL